MSDPVSRETNAAPPEPEVARGVFGDRLALARQYADLLATDGTIRGLIGPREAPRLWERHLLNCAVVADLIPHDATVADVGSGAGLPGVVLAIRRPDLRVTLVEPLLRRSSFLEEVVAALGLDRVRVLRARAEELSGSEDAGRFDVVTSRAVAPLRRLLPATMPLLRPGGQNLAMKGSSAAEELEAVRQLVDRCGGRDAQVLHLGENVVPVPTTVVRVWQQDGAGGTGAKRPGRSAPR